MTSYQMDPNVWKVISEIAGNDKCCDCEAENPEWAAVSHGIVLCMKCSGPHRGLGVHISFVRSIHMDAWSEAQIKAMKLGGNGRCNNYLKTNGGIERNTPIAQKYDNDTAQLYKLQLKARVAGLPEPTQLPPPKKPVKKESKYQGFGSSPPPPPKKKHGNTIGVVVVSVVVALVVGFLSKSQSQ